MSNGLTTDEAQILLLEWGRHEVKACYACFFKKCSILPLLWESLCRELHEEAIFTVASAAFLALSSKSKVAAFTLLGVQSVKLLHYAYQVSKGRTLQLEQIVQASIRKPAVVKRDGMWTELDSRLLVPGDLVKLAGQGSAIPADCKVHGPIKVEEASLTGEFSRNADTGSIVYWSGYVISGEAEATVESTGINTEWGRSMHFELEIARPEDPWVRKTFELLSKRATTLGLAATLMMITRGYFAKPLISTSFPWLNILRNACCACFIFILPFRFAAKDCVRILEAGLSGARSSLGQQCAYVRTSATMFNALQLKAFCCDSLEAFRVAEAALCPLGFQVKLLGAAEARKKMHANFYELGYYGESPMLLKEASFSIVPKDAPASVLRCADVVLQDTERLGDVLLELRAIGLALKAAALQRAAMATHVTALALASTVLEGSALPSIPFLLVSLLLKDGAFIWPVVPMSPAALRSKRWVCPAWFHIAPQIALGAASACCSLAILRSASPSAPLGSSALAVVAMLRVGLADALAGFSARGLPRLPRWLAQLPGAEETLAAGAALAGPALVAAALCRSSAGAGAAPLAGHIVLWSAAAWVVEDAVRAAAVRAVSQPDTPFSWGEPGDAGLQ